MPRSTVSVMSSVSVSSVAYSSVVDSTFSSLQGYSVSLTGTGSAFVYLQGSLTGSVWVDLPGAGSSYKRYALAGETSCACDISNHFPFVRLKIERISGTPIATASLFVVGY